MKEAQKLIEAARFSLCMKAPYIAQAVFAMAPIFSRHLPAAMAVDRRWRLFIHPDLVTAWTVEETAAVLYHEVLHLILDHAGRADALGVEAADAASWNAAADAEINDNLRDQHWPLPEVPWQLPSGRIVYGQPVFPETLGQPPGLLAETYYLNMPCSRPSYLTECLWLGEEGSGVTGYPAAWEQGVARLGDESLTLPPGISEKGAEVLRQAIAHEIQRDPGTVPAGLRRWATKTLSPPLDWRRVLRTAVRRAIATGQGQIDYRYDRPSRRQVISAAILPRLRAPIPRVLLVIDTSGSIGDCMLAAVLTEVEAIVRAVGVAVDVACGDVALQRFQRGVFRADAIELAGGGGTDLGAVLAELRRHGMWDIAVVFTDGWTPWPARCPLPCPVIVALPEWAPLPPAWAHILPLPSS